MTTRRHIGALVGVFALAASVLAGHAASAAAQTTAHGAGRAPRYSFQSIASPNDPTFTQLLGINDHQVIAGYFGSGQTISGTLHPNKGFVLIPAANFTPENYPNSAQTQVIGINNHGDTGGFYVDDKGNTHGFLRMHGTFTSVDLPGTTFNQILGLNNRDQAAGYFQDAAMMNHAYVREPGGEFLVLPFPNSQATGINDAGVVIGFTQPTTSTSSGFILRGGDGDDVAHVTMLTYPGSTFTQPLGENNAGQIVGTYNDQAGNTHGFVYQHGAFRTVDVPGASGTVVNGINDAGRIVGFYTASNGNTVGFVGRLIS